MPRPLAALGIDIDNTLYPCTPEQMEGWNERSSAIVGELTGLDPDAARALTQELYTIYGSTLCGLHARGFEVDPQAFFDRVHDLALVDHLEDHPRLNNELARIALPKFPFTNGDVRHASHVLDRLGIAARFEEIIHIETMELRAKPDPRAFDVLLAHVRLAVGAGVEPAMIGIVEDSIANIRAAKKLGYRTIHVRHGVSFDDEAIDVAVDTILEVRSAVERLVSGD